MGVQVRKSAGLAIVYDNQILLAKTAGRKNKKSWGIPKGGIEPGESPIDAAIRETYEELGIKVDRSLIDPNSHQLFVNAKKWGYVKDIYYFIVHVEDLSQIGLKDLKVPTKQLDTDEISKARFMGSAEAFEHIMISQDTLVRNLLSKGLLESVMIDGVDREPNKELNPTQNIQDEDPRLNKIRRFKASIQDFADFMKDKENETNQPPESKIDIEKY